MHPIQTHLKTHQIQQWSLKSDYGRSSEVPKLRIEEKKQEKRSLEAISRLISPSSSVGSSSPVRSTTPPPDYPFDESIFAELDNSLWIIPRPLGSKSVPEEPDEDYYDSLTIRFSQTFIPRNTKPSIGSLTPLSLYLSLEMPPKRTSTSETPTMTQATIRQLIADGIATALVAQAATMENTNMNYVEEDRVTFATGTLTNDALSWWNAYAQPIGIEQANRITWTKLKRLLTNKYCPRTKVKKMEDEFYNLAVKGNDLKTYVRRF
ncbi:reverse transcriptase domain-containing protein [Tanacetum coccineum]